MWVHVGIYTLLLVPWTFESSLRAQAHFKVTVTWDFYVCRPSYLCRTEADRTWRGWSQGGCPRSSYRCWTKDRFRSYLCRTEADRTWRGWSRGECPRSSYRCWTKDRFGSMQPHTNMGLGYVPGLKHWRQFHFAVSHRMGSGTFSLTGSGSGINSLSGLIRNRNEMEWQKFI